MEKNAPLCRFLLNLAIAISIVCSKEILYRRSALFCTDGRDFSAVNDTIEFAVDVTWMEVMIFITDNSALEDVEQFIVEIEAVPGVFPVAVMDSIATITIIDNDGSQ